MALVFEQLDTAGYKFTMNFNDYNFVPLTFKILQAYHRKKKHKKKKIPSLICLICKQKIGLFARSLCPNILI